VTQTCRCHLPISIIDFNRLRTYRRGVSTTSTEAAPLPELGSYIDGEWRLGPDRRVDTSPANPSDEVAVAFQADAALAEHAVAAAAAAADRWRATTAPSRGEILREAARILDVRVDEIARDLTREEGKTLPESVREVQLAARVFRYYAGLTLDADGETFPSHDAEMLLFSRREPVGVVAAITPWNFPISLPSWKIAPALAFGNTVVWKPADIVPLVSVHLARALADAGLPPGVFNLLIGKGSQVGNVLVDAPQVHALTFTGSTGVGRALQARASTRSLKLQLELGGKNPAVVLADADLGHAARQVSIGAFGSSGQKCTATSRVIVERTVADELIDRLAAEAETWELGDPLDEATTMGPLASHDQLTTVLAHVDAARREGGEPVVGGRRLDGPLAAGYFVPPTVFRDVSPRAAVAREEIFGPVVAVIAVADYDEAIAVANDTPYGLSASVFTHDLTRALRFARESRTGVVRVNQGTSGMEYHVPFGGMKDSGVGDRELGKAARGFYTESKTVYLGVG
jgi:alpha-ketoglutaric semialdehyde dehydrogenase